MVDLRWFRGPLLIGIVGVLGFGLPLTGVAAPAAEIAGNTYTSPQFGYSVTWNDSWFVIEEESSDIDTLDLSDGLTFGRFLGENAFAGNAQASLVTLIAIRSREPSNSNFQPLVDSAGNTLRGGDATHAFGAFSYTYTSEDGSTIELAEYVDTRTVEPGQSGLLFFGSMPIEFFEMERPVIEELLAGVVIPGQEANAEPVEPDLLAGEPAPVYVTGPWRVAVAAAALDERQTRVGLDAKDGKEWLVVVADVTNWSDKNAEFAAKQFTVEVDGSTSRTKLAAAGTKTAARELDLGSTNAAVTVPIAAGKTARVVLVFSLRAGSENPVLVRDGNALPLLAILEVSIDQGNLPALAGPPKLAEGEIVSASDGATLRVQMAGKDKANKIGLLGVEAPKKGDCAADAATARLSDLKGDTVLLERDDAVTGGSGAVRYVWIVNRDGTRSLLNQQVIAEGFGTASAPADSRFGAWLDESERTAKPDAASRLADCATPEPAEVPATPAATPTASPAASPGASPRAASPIASPIASPSAGWY